MNLLLHARTRSTVYTIAKKYVVDPNEPRPVPGSLEEDLAVPDQFLEARRKLERENATPFDTDWRRLNPTDVFARAETVKKRRARFADEGEDAEPPPSPHLPAGGRSFRSITTSSKDVLPRVMKQQQQHHTKLVEIKDEDLLRRYEEIESRVHQQTLYSTVTTFSPVRNRHEFRETRQERFFGTHSRTQSEWRRGMARTCASVGRRPEDSVVTRAEGYREKVEKSRIMELVNPSALIYGAQGWYLSLRKSPVAGEVRHYAVPMGNNYDRLWVQIIDETKREEEFVRSPGRLVGKYKTFKDNPFLVARERAESRRLRELVPVEEGTLDGLVVSRQSKKRVGSGQERAEAGDGGGREVQKAKNDRGGPAGRRAHGGESAAAMIHLFRYRTTSFLCVCAS